MQAVQARTRITLKNILFATDFSPAAHLAALIAIQIARPYGAQLYGVHMKRVDEYTAPATDTPIAAPYAISLAQENQAHLVLLHVMEDPQVGDLVDTPEVVDLKQRKLQHLVTEQAGLWCEPTYVVEQGPAAEKILDVAKRRHTDLIVLGARPAQGLARHLNVGWS